MTVGFSKTDINDLLSVENRFDEIKLESVLLFEEKPDGKI